MGIEQLKAAYESTKHMAGGKHGPKSFSHMVTRCRELVHGIYLNGTEVLEVGAGGGFLSHYLAECVPVRSVVALDEYAGHGSPVATGEMITAMQSALNNSERLTIVRKDFLRYEPGPKFDRVICVNVLHHIINFRVKEHGGARLGEAETALRHVARCLKPGGMVVIQELSNRNWCFLPGYRSGMSHVSWESKLPPADWREALVRAGFDNVDVRYRLPLNLPRWNWLRPLFNNEFVSLLMDSSFVVTARFV